MIKQRVAEHLAVVKDKGYDVFSIHLVGSQNYQMHTKDSDIDTKCIIIPSLDDILSNRSLVSKTYHLDNGEQVDVKDIRLMFDNYKKQNINYIETLFTDYYIANKEYQDLFDKLMNHAEGISQINKLRAVACMAGMSKQKLKALTHPYPTIKDKIDNYGYDPKQLHHIARMNIFIKSYIVNDWYEECLVPKDEDLEWLIKLKTEIIPIEEAIELATKLDEETYSIYSTFIKQNDGIKDDEETLDLLSGISKEAIKRKIKKELI